MINEVRQISGETDILGNRFLSLLMIIGAGQTVFRATTLLFWYTDSMVLSLVKLYTGQYVCSRC